MPETLIQQKAALRVHMRAVRKAAHAKAGPSVYAAVAGVLLDGMDMAEGAVVAAYWPTGSEFDVRPLMHALAAAGAQLALPVIAGDGMAFRKWQVDAPLEAGPHNIMAPPASAEILQPHFVIAPLLAMDAQGHRLGQGGGYYDRTLAALRTEGSLQAVIGLGFADQLVDHIPHEAHDVPMDYILTPRQFFAVKD